MVDHFADRVEAAGSRTGVVALVVPSTGKRSVTVGVDNTLGPAAGVRVSEVFWSTGALATRASHRSIGIWTTRVRVARIPWRGRSWGGKSLEIFLNRCYSRKINYTFLQIIVLSQNAIQNCWCKMQSRQTIIQNWVAFCFIPYLWVVGNMQRTDLQ